MTHRHHVTRKKSIKAAFSVFGIPSAGDKLAPHVAQVLIAAVGYVFPTFDLANSIC
jgi:hypothetical protein